MEKIPDKKNSTPNRIKLIVLLITCILLILVIFWSAWGHNESPETISYEFQKEESIINHTGNIWISKITIPKTVIFENSFVGIVEIISNNNSDQTIGIRSNAGVSFFQYRLTPPRFSSSLITEIPSNSTIVVEIKYNVDSEFYSHIANNTIPTGIALYQDDYYQNLTEGKLYLSSRGFDLTIIKYSYANSVIMLSVILITGYASLKIIDCKFKKEPVDGAPPEEQESDKSS